MQKLGPSRILVPPVEDRETQSNLAPPSSPKSDNTDDTNNNDAIETGTTTSTI